MYKVVISQQDREQLCLMRETVLSAVNEVFVYVAESGKDTIEVVKKERPDIVFLSIELSDISGIDVATEIIRIKPDVNIVFVSKYDYFEFARAAMNLGVKDYLIAPVTRTDIISVTNNLITKINMQEEFKSISKKNDEFIEASKDLLGYGFVYSILFENNMRKDISEYRNTLGISGKGFWYNIEVEDDSYGRKIKDGELSTIVQNVLEPLVKHVIGPRISNKLLVYVSVSEGDIRFNNDKYIKEISTTIKKNLEEKLKVKANIGIGSIQNIEDLHISYDESIRSLRRKNDIVKYTGSNENEEHVKNSILEKRLLESLEIGNDDVRNVFSLLLEQYEGRTIAERRICIFELFVIIAHKINGMGSCEWDTADSSRLFAELQDLREDEIDNYARGRFEYLLKSVKASTVVNLSSVVKMAIQYMYEHYNENISLNDISKLVGVSVQYFSKLFKEEMGCNYVDWLNTLRIKRAKELMNTSHLSIKEVGFKVGYNDPNYFSRIFKRYEGIAPTEYAGRREVC
ncbi:MAG: helix-turn-helix domain-containing protein [Lachnospiraceae bacterium]|nr:helix-turn-helix domain-containing protein [Lachnospiraceae bacterium]